MVKITLKDGLYLLDIYEYWNNVFFIQLFNLFYGGLLLQLTASNETEMQNVIAYLNDNIQPIMKDRHLKYHFLENTPQEIDAAERRTLDAMKEQASLI